ncbi:MAG: hypothetical protein ACOC1F_02730 [Myxococcota bacterium]
MADPKPACGPHTEILKTDGVRVTRCPCGTVHVTMVKNGTTLQLGPSYFNEVVQALSLARTVIAGQGQERPVTSLDASKFVSIPAFDPKKPSN